MQIEERTPRSSLIPGLERNVANYETLEDLTAVLKNVYLPIRKKAFPLLTPLVANARRAGPDKVRYAGNDLFFDVKLGRRGGFVSSARGFLPEHNTAEERQGRLGITRLYARPEVDGLSDAATRQSKGAFISQNMKVVEDVMDQWQIEQERCLHGDSTGIRAVVDTVTDTTHIIVDNPYGITDAGPGNLHLVVGDTIAVLSSTGATQRGKAKITVIALSADAATLTLDTAIAGMVAGDVVVTAVPTAISSTDNSFGAEPHGLKSIVDIEANFATFEGINHARWLAQTLSSTTIDETLVMRLLNTIRARAGIDWRANPKAMGLFTSTGIWQLYGDSLLGLRRFDAPTMELNGGFRGVQVAGATLIDDPWGPRKRLYAVHFPDTIFIDLMDFGELKFKDSPTWVRAANRDAWEVVFATYWNYGVTMRSSHGCIYNITDSVNYSPVF